MGEALISGGGGGFDVKIYKWKRYNVLSETRYKWEQWDLQTDVEYKWNKWDTATQYIWDKYNCTMGTIYEPIIEGTWVLFLDQEVYGRTGLAYQNALPYINQNNQWEMKREDTFYVTASGSSVFNVTFPIERAVLKNGAIVYYFDLEKGSSDVLTGNLGYGSVTATIWDGQPSMSGRADVYITNESQGWVKGTLNSTATSTNPSAYPDGARWSTDGFWYERNGTEIIRGSNLQGQVTALNNSGAYPPSGVSGSFWYEAAGSTNLYSCGESLLGTVESSSESTYPNPGQQSGYWYQNRSSYIYYSMGTYKDHVYSTARNTYPDNGHSAGYWYVFEGEVL